MLNIEKQSREYITGKTQFVLKEILHDIYTIQWPSEFDTNTPIKSLFVNVFLLLE